ncbi:MAG: hypothetical protein V7K27_25040 [Nostoc sp.]|uniref:hypothetical protein n=1 Tax=Nostoc sp. TaxID=1180 RepID=UPI002FF963E4
MKFPTATANFLTSFYIATNVAQWRKILNGEWGMGNGEWGMGSRYTKENYPYYPLLIISLRKSVCPSVRPLRQH